MCNVRQYYPASLKVTKALCPCWLMLTVFFMAGARQIGSMCVYVLYE